MFEKKNVVLAAVKENQAVLAKLIVGSEVLAKQGAASFGDHVVFHIADNLRYLLPNVAATIIILATIGLGAAILAESALSFLGFGVPPPYPSWGAMLSGSGRSFMYRAPWMAVWPGVAISLAVFGFNMLGDALRDVLDPRLRGGR